MASRTTGALISVTPSVLAPDENGTLVIPITHPDSDTSSNDDDVRVSIRILPFGSDPDADDYNGARGGPVDVDSDDETPDVITTAFEDGDDYIAADDDGVVQFTDDIIFSDDDGDPTRYLIAAESVDYRAAPGPTGNANNYVAITVLDQYGRPVRGFPVNAVSDRNNTPDGEGTSTLPFVQYYTTRSNGSYAVNYSYSGGPATETLQVFGHEERPNRDTDETTDGLEEPSGDTAIDDPLVAGGETLREGVASGEAAGRANNATVYWAGVGREINSPDDGYLAATILVVDAENRTFVVEQAEGDVENDPAPLGPHMYSWDSVDTFTVGTTPVSMELFEEILETSLDEDSKIGVTIDSLSWTSYNYTRPVDRANWVIQATCTGGPNDADS